MSLTPASITSAKFSAKIKFESMFPNETVLPLNVSVLFNDAKKLRQYIGSYKPNNDYIYLAQSLSLEDSFNFMIVLASAQLNLSCQFQKSNFNIPVQRFGFYSWTIDAANFCSGAFVDGRLGPNPGNTPMPQDKEVSYQIIVGQAVIR